MPAPVPDQPVIVLLTGVMASGKSTVGQALAERLPRSVHLRGDVFRRMIVNGREEYGPEPTEEAVRQVELRYRLASRTADAYFTAGFSVVLQDVVLGPELPAQVARIVGRPLLVVVLAPEPAVVARREAGRAKNGYGEWTPAQLDAGMRATTPRLGLWLDNSHQTPAETVDEILTRAWTEAAVP
ncbi:P-loop nucleotide/nucleoside kinase family protein [Micromonospora zhanjiangensis]|uniref:AAA family ATPase n=1 Tax=Micromonospora zhanjiangensis TaxID=1522057 RepID=A0ABV8KL57_9ACTN